MQEKKRTSFDDWFWAFIGIVLIGSALYSFIWLPYKQKLDGYTVVDSWDCPTEYPVKANLKSMIYHLPGDPYYDRTDASNGECFDGSDHAEQQGFRAIFR